MCVYMARKKPTDWMLRHEYTEYDLENDMRKSSQDTH